MKIVYWSDYACPYCYIAEKRLHKAVAELGMEKEIEYEPRAFELDPGAPMVAQGDTPSRFAAKYRLPLEQAKTQVEHISSLGRAEGIDFRYATTQYSNTFNAHRLMKLALSTGDREKAANTNELLFAAYFTRNLQLADNAVLLEVGQLAGLEESEVREVLESDRFGAEVRADEEAAARRGVHGVPYFVFPGGFSIPGAVSLSDFKLALQSARVSGSGGHQCGPNGCRLD